MPLPILIGGGIAVSSAIAGAWKLIRGVSDNCKARKTIEEAKDVHAGAKQRLQDAKSGASLQLSDLGKLKLDVWSRQLGRFVELFELMKHVRIEGAANVEGLDDLAVTPECLREMKAVALNASTVIAGGLASLSTGVLVGFASYGGAMMFASASTGTAIATLSGAAATNATLAFFGGGSLATGGLGIAGGTAILGGLVLAPAIALGGLLYAARASKNLAQAKQKLAEARRAAEEMNKATSVVTAIKKIAEEFSQVIRELDDRMTLIMDRLEKVIVQGYNKQQNRRMRSVDSLVKMGAVVEYPLLSEKQKSDVLLSIQFAQVMRYLLETPLLSKQGAPTEECKLALNTGQGFLGHNNAT